MEILPLKYSKKNPKGGDLANEKNEKSAKRRDIRSCSTLKREEHEVPF